MKSILALAIFVIGTNVFAQGHPCLTLSHTDASFIKTAIDVLPIGWPIASVSLDRKSHTLATAVIKSGNSKMAYIIEQNCDGKLVAKAKSSTQFKCISGWIDCMPPLIGDAVKLCSQEYSDWAEANCGGRPSIAE